MFEKLSHYFAFFLILAMILCMTLGLSLDAWTFERFMSVLSNCPDIYRPVARWFSSTYIKLTTSVFHSPTASFSPVAVGVGTIVLNIVYYLLQFLILGSVFFVQVFIYILYFMSALFVVV